MKILYGITKSNFGGAQRYVFDLAREAKMAGHDTIVIAGEGGVLIERLKAENIKTILVPGFSKKMDLFHDAPRLWFIIKTIWHEKPDVFHINSAKMGGAGIFAGRLLGIKKIIFTAHGFAWNEPRPIWQKILIKFFTWLTILSAHKTICVSDKTCRQVSNWPFTKNKLVVVHNGIEKFDILPCAQARRALGIHEDDKLIVGTLAELHPVKGLDILLEAWDKYARKHDAQLVILGDGEYRDTLLEYAQILGITDSVMFKGYIEDARQYLLAFDIFVLPSRSEALPYTILEAGFAGLPVIATEVGGIPEVIESGISGVLIETENPEMLFSTLILLSENKDLRKRLGESLEKTVLKDFSIKKMTEQTFKNYL